VDKRRGFTVGDRVYDARILRRWGILTTAGTVSFIDGERVGVIWDEERKAKVNAPENLVHCDDASEQAGDGEKS
jgi:hypothetical protein